MEELQQRNGLKYVIVTDGKKPIGMISQTDILNDLLAQNGGVREELRRINSIGKLTKVKKRLVSIARDAREHNHRATAAAAEISKFHLSVQRRCVELALEEIEAKKAGPAPAKFVILTLDSGGRREMLLGSAQSNAIVIGAPTENLGKKERQWFAELGGLVNQRLTELGYQPSRSGILAARSAFQKTLDEWRCLIDDTFRNPDPGCDRAQQSPA